MSVEVLVSSSAPLAQRGVARTSSGRVADVVGCFVRMAARSEPAAGVAVVIRVAS